MPDGGIMATADRGRPDAAAQEALPDELRAAAAALVAELRANPLLAGFSEAELYRLVCSSGYRRTLERQHLAMLSGFRPAAPDSGRSPGGE